MDGWDTYCGQVIGCVFLPGDLNNCGSCGHQCGANEGCFQGGCSCLLQGAHVGFCSGGCFDLWTDVNHCGQCAMQCAAGQSCVSGQCM